MYRTSVSKLSKIIVMIKQVYNLKTKDNLEKKSFETEKLRFPFLVFHVERQCAAFTNTEELHT